MLPTILFVCAGICALAAVQERKDLLRCVGFVAFGLLLALFGLVARQWSS